MNKLLLRQIGKFWKNPANVPSELNAFLETISQTYDHHDRDRKMLERSIILSSDEMIALNENSRTESLELKKAQRELETLFDNIDTVFFTVDMIQNKVIQMSPSCGKLYGYTTQEFLDNSQLWFDVIVEEDRHIIESNYSAMYAGNKFSHTHRIKTKNGDIRWIETKITPTLATDGQVIRIDGVSTDVTAQKEAEEQTRQQERRFTKLIEHSHDGILLLGTDSRVQYSSPAVVRILGYTTEELHATDPVDYIHPEDYPHVMATIRELMNTPGASKNITHQVKNKEGEWRFMNTHITNLLNEDSVNAIVVNYEDITERIEAARQIEFDRRNRDALINSSKDLMWSFDSELRLITANKPFLAAMKYGTGLDFVPGDKLLPESSTPLQTIVKWKELYSRVLNGESFTCENFEAPFGQWAELSLSPIIENGKVIGGSCAWHDITEKKNNNEKLLSSERMMAEAQRLSSLGSWELNCDAHGKVIEESLVWSSEVYRIYGYDRSTHIPSIHDIDKHLLEQDSNLMSEWNLALMGGDSPGSIDVRIHTTSGELRWLKIRADLIFDQETRKRSKIVGTIQDITERKSLEKERVQVNKDLILRNKALEQFAHIVSHNLRAPVANIMGLSNLIKLSSNDPATQADCIKVLNISAQRLDEIIKDLNKILQLKRGVSEEKDLVNFESLVSNIKDSIRIQLADEQVTIYTDFSEVGEVYTIKNYMHSIFLNLISNSIKYRQSHVHPVIEITTRQEEGKMLLSFKDNCMGIDLEKYGNNVFGLYKRFHYGIEGKGLGMYMVKTQVESLGGKVAIKSEVNKGTEITIELSVA